MCIEIYFLYVQYLFSLYINAIMTQLSTKTKNDHNA